MTCRGPGARSASLGPPGLRSVGRPPSTICVCSSNYTSLCASTSLGWSPSHTCSSRRSGAAFGAEDRCWLLLAERGGHTIAGAVFIRAVRPCTTSSTLQRSKAGGPARTTWSSGDAINRARTAGLSCIDLGLSPEGQDGLVQFKRSFASTEDTIIDVERRTTDQREAQRASGEPRAVATDPRCPDYLTEAIGAGVYSLFA